MPSKYVQVKCSECGKDFPRRADRVKNPAETGPYCSSTCQVAGMKKHDRFKRGFSKSVYQGVHMCPTCSEEFTPHHPSVVYCSKLCRTQAQNARTAARYRDRAVVGGEYARVDRKLVKAVLLVDAKECICGRSFDSIELKQIHVDHSHATGKLRGLLCSNCNQGLGNFKDSIKNLEAAIEYLKRWSDE